MAPPGCVLCIVNNQKSSQAAKNLLAELHVKNSRKFVEFASFAAYLPSSALSAPSAVKLLVVAALPAVKPVVSFLVYNFFFCHSSPGAPHGHHHCGYSCTR